jgi:hypothetical protein
MQRTTRQRQLPASSRKYTGHQAGIHPEDDLEDDDSYYVTRPPTSARRYTTQPQVIQQGNRRLVIHQQAPQRQLHWSLILGTGMVFMLALWVLGSYALNLWNTHQLDSTYGMPRTFQTDAVVGHNDSLSNPSHFIAINLNGKIMIIELQGGDPTKAKIYPGPAIYSENGGSTPVTLQFKDTRGNGKLDMLVVVGNQTVVYMNTGTDFKPQQ